VNRHFRIVFYKSSSSCRCFWKLMLWSYLLKTITSTKVINELQNVYSYPSDYFIESLRQKIQSIWFRIFQSPCCILCFYHNFIDVTQFLCKSYCSELLSGDKPHQYRIEIWHFRICVAFVRDTEAQFLYVYWSLVSQMASVPNDTDSFQCHIFVSYWCF
jgi:hypothetical protein